MSVFLTNISNFIIPMLIFYIIAMGIGAHCKVYELFIRGARKGFDTVIKIMPTMVGLMIAVGILRSSGFLDWLEELLCPLTARIGFPSALLSLTIVKMFSSSAAIGIALDLFKEYGTDSFIGKVTSISMSCTETIFYTMSVYFMTAKVTKSRWTLAGGLISTIVGVMASIFLAKII